METSRRVLLLPGALLLLAACSGCATTTCYMLDLRGIEGCRVERVSMPVGYDEKDNFRYENVRFAGAGAVVVADSMRIEGTTRDGATMWASLATIRGATLTLTNQETARTTRVDAIALPSRPGWSPPGHITRIVRSNGTSVGVSKARIDAAGRMVTFPRAERRRDAVGGDVIATPVTAGVDSIAFSDIAWIQMRRYDGTKSGVLYGVFAAAITVIAIAMAGFEGPAFSVSP